MTSALAQLAKGCLPPSGLGELAVPSPVMAEGEHAATRYVEFFTAQIRNPNTRAAGVVQNVPFLGNTGNR